MLLFHREPSLATFFYFNGGDEFMAHLVGKIDEVGVQCMDGFGGVENLWYPTVYFCRDLSGEAWVGAQYAEVELGFGGWRPRV